MLLYKEMKVGCYKEHINGSMLTFLACNLKLEDLYAKCNFLIFKIETYVIESNFCPLSYFDISILNLIFIKSLPWCA